MRKSNELAAGQWWLHFNGKVMFIAFDERTFGTTSSLPILAYSDTFYNNAWYPPESFVRRLPDDAGFDYKPEPEIVYPVWCLPNDSQAMSFEKKPIAFFRYDEDYTGETFHTDGTSFKFTHDGAEADIERRVTQNVAEARIVKPKSIPEIQFDPKTFTSDWGPFEQKCPDRWFIWSDNRYPIAFVKHASGQVFNLNVDSILKQSDDWHHGYEEQLANGELVEVTEFSAKAFLTRPRSASQIPKHEPTIPNRIPVRLWGIREYLNRQGMAVLCCPASVGPPTNEDWVEIKFDPQLNITASGFYVEGGK